MGCWCAVYAPAVRVKAEGRPERARRRNRYRAANRRGLGASFRRKERRALSRSAPRRNETEVPQAIGRSMRKLSRIEKLDDRFSRQIYRSLDSIRRESLELEKLGASYERLSKGNGVMGILTRHTTKDYLEDLAFARYKGIRRLTERLMQACMGHWGFPHDATLKRLSMTVDRAGGKLYMSDDPLWRAVPRMKPSHVVAMNDKKDALRYASTSAGLSAQIGAGASAHRTRINRGGEGNRVSFCRRCGARSHDGDCVRKPPPPRRGPKGKLR